MLDDTGHIIESTFTNSAWMARQFHKSIEFSVPPTTTKGVVQIGPDSGESDPAWVSVPVFFGTAIVPTFHSYFLYVV